MGLCSICLREDYSHKLFGIFLLANFSIFLCLGMHSWIFILYFGSRTLYLFCCSSCLSTGHWELFQLDPVAFGHSPIRGFLFLFCCCFLASHYFCNYIIQDALGSSGIVPVSVPDQLFLPKVLVPFIGECQTLRSALQDACWGSVTSLSQLTKQANVCVCVCV